jgi:hypothetical protein
MFKEISVRFLLVEVIAFFCFFLAAGYRFNSSDPFFTNSPINPYLLLLLVFTLYYGISAGLTALLVSLPFIKFSYEKFPVNFFLWSLLYVFVAGEFHFFWNRKIQVAEEESKYFKEKLRRQTSDFILLKLSHDQLEKHYMIKPISLRRLLTAVKEELLSGRGNTAEKFMDLLVHAFYVQSASLYLREGSKYNLFASVGKKVELDLNDPLISEALNRRRPVFISQIGRGESKYLSVIPIFDLEDEEKLLGLFLLREIPFNYLNADTVLSLSVALLWFINELKGAPLLRSIPDKLRRVFSYEFLKELSIVHRLNEKTGVESSVVVYKVPSLYEDFVLFVKERIRGMDVVDAVTLKDGKLVFVLLPLSPLSAAEGFVKRIEKEILNIYGSHSCSFSHRYVKVDNKIYEKLLNFIEEKSSES